MVEEFPSETLRRPSNSEPPAECDLVEVSEGTSKETRCGFLGFNPRWLQKLASKKSYMLIYGLLGMNQSALASYYVATITTFEKRFKLPSTYSGVLTSSWDVGSLFATMLIAYYGSNGHKTRIVAYWSLLAGLSCFARLLPHTIYGPGSETISIGHFNRTLNMTKTEDPVCLNPYGTEENCALNEEGSVAALIVLITQLFIGIGTSAYYCLGAAYLDDNVNKNKFPLLFAIAACLRYIGPTMGYVLASFTLSKYINPEVTPDFDQNDSRWIGSWQLGWIPLGIFQVSMALAIAFFPRTLPREAIRRQKSNVQTQSKVKKTFTDFKKTMKRLMTNRILMYNTFSTTFYVFGLTAFWIFMPKYIETQFRKSAAGASIITGSVGLACTAIGIMISGATVSRLKPRATYIAIWNVFTESVDVVGQIIFAFIGCQKDDLQGSVDVDGRWQLNQTCNLHCDCDPRIPYSPVCSNDGSQMFFSPCHAGCLQSSYINGSKMYTNCSCIEGSLAMDGPCPVDCDNQFVIFLALLCFMKFLSATGRAGNTIIQYRSVSPEDKSVSIAFTEITVCAICFIPAPVLYGAIVDSACQVWGYICGQRGNCLLYYGKDLRYLLNFTSSGFLIIGLLLDVGVLMNVGSLKIYDDEKEIPATSKEKNETPNSVKENQLLLASNIVDQLEDKQI